MKTDASSRRSPVAFFLLALALSVPFWLLGAVANTYLPLPMNLPVSALGFSCPLMAASILVYREDRLEGVKSLLKRVFDHKSIGRKIWYAPIILLNPLVMLLSYGVMRLMGLPLPEPHISLLSIPILFVLFFIGAAGEEVGWMGYAVDPMQARWSALKAGIVLGLVWVIFHIVPLIQARRTPRWVAWWSLSTVALRILIVWLYNNTGKSVLSAVLFHDMINVGDSLFPNEGSHYNPAVTGPILGLVALIVTFLWGPKTLARYRYADRSH